MKKEKGKKIWIEVSDFAGELRTHGEYFKKKPESWSL